MVKKRKTKGKNGRKRKKTSKRKTRVSREELLKLAAGWHDLIAPYLSSSGRKKLKKKCGSKAFLDPKHLKYPVINPKTCKVSPKGLAAAALRAQMTGNKKVYEEAIKKLKKLGYL